MYWWEVLKCPHNLEEVHKVEVVDIDTENGRSTLEELQGFPLPSISALLQVDHHQELEKVPMSIERSNTQSKWIWWNRSAQFIYSINKIYSGFF